MRQLFLLPVLWLFLAAGNASDPPISDPSAAYCKLLGYKYEIRKDHKGDEHGVVVFPNGRECDSWDFYRGICGREFSYCAKKGCETTSVSEDQGAYKIVYCACSCKDSLGRIQTIPLQKFMEQHGDTLIKPVPGRK